MGLLLFGAVTFWGCSILGVFLDQGGLLFGHSFRYFSFLWASIHCDSQSVVDRGEFFEPKSMYVIKTRVFPVRYIFSVVLSESRCISTLGPSSSIRNFFFMLLIYSSFFCYDLSVPIFCSKIFLSPLHPVACMCSPLLSRLVGRIFFRCLGMSCFIWFCLGIFLVFVLSPVLSESSLWDVFFVLTVVLFRSNSSAFFCFVRICEVHTINFQTFFVWALLLIVHTWNPSPIPSNILWLQCTCCTVPTTSWRPHGRSPLVRACQWPLSQPLSSPQLFHNDSLWA